MVCFVFDDLDCLEQLGFVPCIVLNHIFTWSANAVVFMETNMEVVHCSLSQDTRIPKQDTNRIFRIVTAPVVQRLAGASVKRSPCH